MIGQWKRGVDLITINRIRIDRPSADHRHAFVFDFFQHARAVHARRTNQDFAGDLICVVAFVVAERLAELLVNARHLVDGAVQHRLETGVRQRAKNLLRFA